ncbi:[protein release factor]-glutamine N5-methyltransferase [Methylophilus rhizosphaerae]|uniref:Release factor glutamine methyltransferase n=1 Tax=Methylophilus rhizosphaerae TaxID=492660 RepID=A0A1G9E563_9PROT|nr:peptide chain release factor N(5)-glutamine methyltransferase [Methylophilus rhizosphaerae]SDK71306.1 [protein release factor]-glutamine N5-methyltransferase [Methylophilus rhizosphaerae]
MPLTLQQLLMTARQQLAQVLPPGEARSEAQLLLMHVLAINRAWLIAHGSDEVTAQHAQVFNQLVQRRLQGEPVAYMLGYREFFGLRLKVTPDTLIPRPDTETLVEAALQKISGAMRVLDLGTGTGAIALAMAQHAPQAQVTAVDASVKALAVARENAQSLQLGSVRCVHSDWFEALAGQTFDLIVSNPPYIEDSDPHLAQGDLRFEPYSALASGADGLQDIDRIIASAPTYLHTKGWLMLEHGYNQAEAVQQRLAMHGFQAVETRQDLGGNPRVTLGQWDGSKPV